jgi:CheY-like chemotaxis protein
MLADAALHVLLAESHPDAAAALALMLYYQPGLVVTGPARRLEDVLGMVCSAAPDIILMDWRMPGFEPERHVAELVRCRPRLYIIGISAEVADERNGLAHGAHDFVGKSEAASRLVQSLQTARTALRLNQPAASGRSTAHMK